MAASSFETAETFKSSAVRQISVFLEDRVGTLLRLFQAFEGTTVRVLGLSVVHAIDCAIVRLICDDTDTALRILHEKQFATSVSELLVVEVPHGHGLITICGALLCGEVNIEYAYPLLVRPTGNATLAIHCDSLETASQILRNRKFALMSEDELGPGSVR